MSCLDFKWLDKSFIYCAINLDCTSTKHMQNRRGQYYTTEHSTKISRKWKCKHKMVPSAQCLGFSGYMPKVNYKVCSYNLLYWEILSCTCSNLSQEQLRQNNTMSYAAFTWNQGNGRQQFRCHVRGQKQGGKLWWMMATLKIDGRKLKYFNFVSFSVTGFTIRCCVAPLHNAKTRQFGELLDITRTIT